MTVRHRKLIYIMTLGKPSSYCVPTLGRCMSLEMDTQSGCTISEDAEDHEAWLVPTVACEPFTS